jgi:hypothetical protein
MAVKVGIGVAFAGVLGVVLSGCVSVPPDIPVQTIDATRDLKLGTSALAADTPRPALSSEPHFIQLIGPAAVYYMYRKNHERRDLGGPGLPPQYQFASEDAIYYRDKLGKPVQVSPPGPGFQVPYREAQEYRDLQGFDRSPRGESNLLRFAAADKHR